MSIVIKHPSHRALSRRVVVPVAALALSGVVGVWLLGRSDHANPAPPGVPALLEDVASVQVPAEADLGGLAGPYGAVPVLGGGMDLSSWPAAADIGGLLGLIGG